MRGAKTRSRLMDAAREMLKAALPIELTAIAVSRAAGTVPPSFYVYFADIRDLLLAIRNLEADRGDRAFDELRVDSSLPVLNGLADLIRAARPSGTRRVEAFSEAVIFYAVLERIATSERTTQPIRLQPKHYKAALARMIAAAAGKPE
jgi:AcrR family transcriptional regulator